MFDLIQLLDCPEDLAPILRFAHSILGILQMAVPIILIIMGTIDLGKAVLSSDEKEIKGATGKLIKRCIAAVLVFFVFTIVSLVMSLVKGTDANGNKYDWKECWQSVEGTGGKTDNDN